MFNTVTIWINNTLFPWFDSSNATHTAILGAVGSILGTIVLWIATWMFLRSWGYARRIAIDESRKTRRYLRSLERRARMSAYWQSASLAQRIHFVALRVTLILCVAVAALVCQGFLALGSIINTLQEDTPRNVVKLIQATKQAADGPGITMLQQLYVLPATLLLCVVAITILFAAMSMVIATLYTIRLAELDNREQLLKAINSIRASLKLPSLSEDSPTLNPPNSLLYPY